MKPFVSIRLLDRFHNDPALTDKLLVLLNRHIKKDADVWLTTSLGFPALEEHKKQALRMKTAAEKIRRNGYTVTLQVANTIGHGDLGKNFSFAMFQKNMQDIDGNEIPYVSCPGNEAFLDYTEKVLSLYAEAVRPDIVYPDDDLRMVGDKQGCFCPDCLARFNGMFGVSYTRETLKKALYEDEDFALSLKWRDFCDASLARVTEAIVRGALKGVSHVKIGLQMCTHMHYERYERVCRTITELTGEKPLLRAGGGVYHDRTPFDFVQKGLDEQFQSAYFSRFIENVRPELEGYPHTAFNKSPRGFNTEASVALAMGCNAVSYAAFVFDNESLETFEPLLASISAYRPYFEKMADIAEHTRAGGLKIPVVPQKLAKDSGNRMDGEEYLALVRCGIPVCFSRDETGLVYIEKSVAESATEEDLSRFFRRGAAVNGEAYVTLKKRGLAACTGVDCDSLSPKDYCPENERLTDDPINRGMEGSNWFCPVWLWAWGRTPVKLSLRDTPSLRVLARYAETGTPAVAAADNPCGGKTAVIGNIGGERTPLNSTHAKMLNRLFAEMTDEGYAYPETPCQVAVILRLDEKGKLKAVTFFHYGMDFLKNVAFTAERTCGDRMVLHRPAEASIPLSACVLPELLPGGVATVEFF